MKYYLWILQSMNTGNIEASERLYDNRDIALEGAICHIYNGWPDSKDKMPEPGPEEGMWILDDVNILIHEILEP